jgi:2,3-bisphosphoglycerate-independent phosphoglycerate mutase
MEKIKKKNNQIILLLLDGFGIAPDGEGNALSKAKMPFFRELIAKYPSAILKIPLTRGQKIADPINCYSALGSGSLSLKNKEDSFLDTLTKANKKWCLLADVERVALASFFLNGRKKASAENCFLGKQEKINSKHSSLNKIISEIPNELIKRIKTDSWNFLGAFMSELETSSRTGDFQLTIQVAEELDSYLKKITKAVLEKGGVMLLSSAFGKAEDTLDVKTDQANKSNTINNVPFIIIGKEFEGKTLNFPETPGDDLSSRPTVGSLADIAPTIIDLLGIEITKKFDGQSLIK